MYRIAIEQFGAPATEAGRIQFALESAAALSVLELIDQAVAREIELCGLKVGAGKLADHQREAARAFACGTFVMLVSSAFSSWQSI
ncbi:MAG: hypothetical protein K9N23_07600 [Akkermansiaceae bacterium]|nr:hypothetical protein [Akkermansiaceae bacterium]MCF7731535.1 hypothetical protein [Akkermansiaceae bacterium]